MSLKEEIKTIIGNRRKFLLLRIADIDVNTARSLVGIRKGTYNSWCQDSRFTELYRRRDEFSANYKQEAIQLLRRDTQLAAVLLEGKIIQKMKDEIESGEYVLVRTNLAKEVYSRLLTDLDIVPPTPGLTFQQRIQQIFTNPPEQIIEGEVVNAELIETTNIKKV